MVQRLRTKTGCLTCRSRHKKCDEELPRCQRCTVSARTCLWPATEDLYDKRHHALKSTTSLKFAEPQAITRDIWEQCYSAGNRRLESVVTSPPGISFLAEIATFSRAHVESTLFGHFFEHLCPLLILPACGSHIVGEIYGEMTGLIAKCDSFRHAILACSAVHLDVSGAGLLSQTALTYYNRSISLIQQSLANMDQSQMAKDSGLLLSVMFLYVYSACGPDTKDFAHHLSAATQLLKMRYANKPEPNFSATPLEIAAIESAVIHTFRHVIWCPGSYSPHTDEAFWSLADRILNDSHGNNNAIVVSKGVVLGIPLSLQRLLTQLVYHFRRPTYMDQARWSLLMAEVAFWESTLLKDGITDAYDKDRGCDNDKLARAYQDATLLYILVASFLFHCCYTGVSQAGQAYQGISHPSSPHLWQVKKALEILRNAKKNDKWVECYIGSWALLFLGYAVERNEDIELIRADLRDRWSLTSFYEFKRIIDELEMLWARGK